MNQRKIFCGIICVLALLTISGCGGGGDDGDYCINPYTILPSGTGYVQQNVWYFLMTGTDITPGDNDDTPLVANFPMSDAVTVATAYSIVAPSFSNSIVVPVNFQQVGRFYLYTANNLGGVPPGMTWELWSNNGATLSLDPWQLEGDALTMAPLVTYDTGNRRFVIQLNSETIQPPDNSLGRRGVQRCRWTAEASRTGESELQVRKWWSPPSRYTRGWAQYMGYR